MISIQRISIFLASIVVAGISLNVSIASAQGNFFCIATYEFLIKQTEDKNQLLSFAGITKTGQPLWFFVNDTEFSVFYKDHSTGYYCTSPNYYGSRIEPVPTED